MLFSILRNNDIRTAIVQVLLTVPVILFALSLHEAAHAWVASLMGDKTARNLGRITANPAKHLDPIGTLCMLVFGFGWAKPVPINARNFKKPKWGMALTALAGPAANLIQGVIGTVLYALFYVLLQKVALTEGSPEFLYYVLLICMYLFMLMGLYNFVLMAFNMLPVPPFDGSRFAFVFLPTKWYFGIMKYERIIMIAVLVLAYVLPFSPASWVANALVDLIWMPCTMLFANIIL